MYKLIGKKFLEAVGKILRSTIAINQQSNHNKTIQTKTSIISSIITGILNIYKEAKKRDQENKMNRNIRTIHMGTLK